MDFPMSAKTHDANARLIAAAPELLAALAEAVDELEQMHRHYYGNCPGGCPACVAIDKARAAIAKATAVSIHAPTRGATAGIVSCLPKRVQEDVSANHAI